MAILKLIYSITSLVHNSFKQKDGKIRYSFIKAGKYGNCYFTKKYEEDEGKYFADSGPCRGILIWGGAK